MLYLYYACPFVQIWSAVHSNFMLKSWGTARAQLSWIHWGLRVSQRWNPRYLLPTESELPLTLGLSNCQMLAFFILFTSHLYFLCLWCYRANHEFALDFIKSWQECPEFELCALNEMSDKGNCYLMRVYWFVVRNTVHKTHVMWPAGKTFRTSDLHMISEFFLMFHKDKPVDWLLDHILWVKTCNPEKDAVSRW